MTILRSGATNNYSQNWAKAFGEKKSADAKSVNGKAKKTKKTTKAKASKVKK